MINKELAWIPGVQGQLLGWASGAIGKYRWDVAFFRLLELTICYVRRHDHGESEPMTGVAIWNRNKDVDDQKYANRLALKRALGWDADPDVGWIFQPKWKHEIYDQFRTFQYQTRLSNMLDL
jgi:hypothetical protein